MKRFVFLLLTLFLLFSTAPLALRMPASALSLAQAETPSATSTPENFEIFLKDLGNPEPIFQQNARRALREMGERAIPHLIFQGLGVEEDTIRQHVLSLLVEVGAPVRQPLIKALKDQEPRVRAGAAQLLGQLRDRKAIRPLIGALGDKEAIVRQQAFGALASIGPPAIDPLIKALLHPSSSVRRNAAVILSKMGPAVTRPLTEAATHENPAMRAAVFRILGRRGDPAAIPVLIRGLGEAQEAVREQAVRGLISFGPRAISPLIKVLNGPDASLHDGAFAALVGVGKNAIPSLVALMQNPKADYKVRAKGVAALRRLQWKPRNPLERIWEHIAAGEWEKIPIIPKAIFPLIVTMENPIDSVRAKASETLVSFGELAVTPLATEILRQKHPFFLESAAQTLGNIGIRDFLAVEALTGLLLKSQFLPVQFSTVEALGKIGNYLAIEPLLSVVEDEKRLLRIRIMAVDALRRLGDPRVTLRLVAALEKAQDVSFREGIVATLGQLRDPRAAPALVALLDGENPAIRKRAEEAILMLRPPPIELLIRALGDRRPAVSQSASYLLTQIGEPATEQLIATLKRRDAPVTIKAKAEFLLIKVLEALPQNVQVMIKALEAPSDRVRLLAVQSLSQIKSVRAVPHLLAISEQEWRYPRSLRLAAKTALQSIEVHVDSNALRAVLAEERRARLQLFVPIGWVILRLILVLSGYWIFTALLGIGLSLFRFPRGLTRPSYWKFLVERVVRITDEPIDRKRVQRGLRMGFFQWQNAALPWLIVSGMITAVAVWARVINSIAGTFLVGGGLFCFILWLQSRQGVEQISRLLDHRRRLSRFMLSPLTYLSMLLFPGAVAAVAHYKPMARHHAAHGAEESTASTPEPFMTLAMLLQNFSHAERIDLLQVLGEYAAGFPPTDPQEVLELVFREAQERLEQREDIRAFLTTLAPTAMALSRSVEEIPENFSKMLALVGSSNSLVKLESFFSEILGAVDAKALKGAFSILLELLQAGFFPTTELVAEAKLSTDRPLLYQSWKETIMTKINNGEFNVNDSLHVALHYTAFRTRVGKSRFLSLLTYSPRYADYKQIIEGRQKGSKSAEREKNLREMAGQLSKFIANLHQKDWVLVGPWMSRRLFEVFGQQDRPFETLFAIGKSGVWIAPPFTSLEERIPPDLSPRPEPQEILEETEPASTLDASI